MTDPSSLDHPQSHSTDATAPAVEAPARPPGFPSVRVGVDGDRLRRGARYLVNEAFQHAPTAIGYYVSQRIADLFPEKALVECREHAFDPVRYGSAGHCVTRTKSIPYPHWILHWEESADSLGKLKNQLSQGWIEVEWDSERLEVLILHWNNERGIVQHAFILADRREIAVRFLRTVCAWNSQPRDELLVYDGHSWKKDEELFRAIKGATFGNLVLPGAMREELLADVGGFFDARETYERYGVPWKRGILFVGPPGNGKTHAVKALINELNQKCLYVQSFQANEYTIAMVFGKARKSAPCILVLEDLDSLVTNRNRSFFLNELDGFAGNDGILTLATTNHPEKLDPAIAERPSRFDRKYHFNLPALEERVTYMARWNASLEPEMRVESATIGEIAEFSAGFSFAYLKELCLAAVMAWIRSPEAGAMERILREQVEALRNQMSSKPSLRSR